MRDAMEARMWAEHHKDFSNSIGHLFGHLKSALASLKPALEHIHSFEWDAPWRRRGAGRA